MKKDKLNILIGGPAGAGIEKSGKVLTLSFVRGGYHVFANVEHMSQIRGGNNFSRIRVDKVAHEVHEEEVDVMIALDKQTIIEHLGEMREGGAVIFDGEVVGISEDEIKEMQNGLRQRKNGDKSLPVQTINFINIPLKKLATEGLGNPIMANVIALGVVCGLIGFDCKILQGVLGKVFGAKGAEIVAANNKAVKIGKELGVQHADEFPVEIKAGEPLGAMFLEGNDCLSLGAVKAGVKFIGEYPMTPSSSILHFMARWAGRYGIVVKHVEDEIAACTSVIGAGFAGVRAMCATSGGGFALMTEAIGLSSMNEVPIVVVNVMRPGPATGQPTRTEAGDLRQVIHGGQGDPVKIVLLPGDPVEAFEMGFMSFNLAEKYQLPVIVCYDKYLGEGFYTVAPFEGGSLQVDRGKLLSEADLTKIDDYKRYLLTEDGVSPRSTPGVKGGIHRATSDEHNEYGEIEEGAENRKAMVEKRMKKMEVALSELPGPEVVCGDGAKLSMEDADVTFVTWSSCKGACKEACELLGAEGVRANVLQIKTAWPFHSGEVGELLGQCKRAILVEQNYDGQMGGLIAEKTGVILNERILKYDGRPMTAKWIVEELEKLKSLPGEE